MDKIFKQSQFFLKQSPLFKTVLIFPSSLQPPQNRLSTPGGNNGIKIPICNDFIPSN